MQFEVKYLRSYYITIISKPKIIYPYFHGKGIVFMNETGLLFQGNIPKFNLWVLSKIYERVLDVQTTRTVPYSTIVEYKRPRNFQKKHEITYRLPYGKTCGVKFIITKDRKMNDRALATKLDEYITVAKSLVNS